MYLKTCAKTGFMLALILLGAVNLANFGWVNAESSAPPGIKGGAYVWYKSVDFMHANKTDYMYAEFTEVHEHTAEIVIRTGLLNSTQSEWSKHPPLYGYLDMESGNLALVGTTQGVGFTFWMSPESFNRNATSGFAPSSINYAQVQCLVFESQKHDQRSWYDQVTGVLIQTSFLRGNLTTGTVVLYETNISVGKVATTQAPGPFEIPAGTITYAAPIALIAVVAAAIIGLRLRKKRETSQAVLVKQCPSCGNKNRDDATFCSTCGTSLAAPSAPVIELEPPVSVGPVRKSRPPVSVVTTTREWSRTTVSPAETRNVCRTCGHVNPEWIRNYCVRCAAKLTETLNQAEPKPAALETIWSQTQKAADKIQEPQQSMVSPPLRFCMYCARNLSPDARFCDACGKTQA